MAALTDSPARIMQRIILSLGLGEDADATPRPSAPLDWTVYCERLPADKPDRAIAVVNVAGQSDGRHQFDGELYAHFGFHVTVRGRTGEEAWRRCERIRTGLAEDATGLNVTYGSATYLVNAVSQIGQVFRAGVEPGTERARYTVTAMLSVTEQTTGT